MENNNIISGSNFKWLKLHIDELYLCMVVRKGNDALKWNFIDLYCNYCKSETEMTYDKACMIISEKYLEKLIAFGDVIKGESNNISIPIADKNWETFVRTKRGQSKGGKKAQKNKGLEKKKEALKTKEDYIQETMKHDDPNLCMSRDVAELLINGQIKRGEIKIAEDNNSPTEDDNDLPF